MRLWILAFIISFLLAFIVSGIFQFKEVSERQLENEKEIIVLNLNINELQNLNSFTLNQIQLLLEDTSRIDIEEINNRLNRLELFFQIFVLAHNQALDSVFMQIAQDTGIRTVTRYSHEYGRNVTIYPHAGWRDEYESNMEDFYNMLITLSKRLYDEDLFDMEDFKKETRSGLLNLDRIFYDLN